eukprot:CAMPEP_0183705730 /NCGR_PEP_ID=MMETSP0737-20130205/2763_1 /TAXON_ID=385413 /ORGANISM="Thalassiosira miniscula, Strain CCMP1093" /LENGTH=598 /DNA_ID=CAMNT_0025932955 /DNA_START=66 /DNA_END=1862 /DNA_ORIENTATION=-
MQSATQATLANLVEQHVTSLIRESAVINRHSNRGGIVSAGDDDPATGSGSGNTHRPGGLGRPAGGGGGTNNDGRRRRAAAKRRRLIHHDDVNMALSWRGSEKLYVSGCPVVVPVCVIPTDDKDGGGGGGGSGKNSTKGSTTASLPSPNNNNNNNNGRGLHRLLQNTDNGKTSVPSLLSSSVVPRVDLNAYLSSELAVKPPSEVGMTLHWLAVDGNMPVIPMNEVWNRAGGAGRGAGATTTATTTTNDLTSGDVAPTLEFDDDDATTLGGLTAASSTTNEKNTTEDSSIRIRELQHRLLSEELQLYYARITSIVENPASSTDPASLSAALRGIRTDTGIQELVPFLSRFVANGLMSKRNLQRTEHCRKLVRLFDAMLDNRSLHLDLHLHQMFTPVGTCIVAKKLSANSHENHWSLREEAARTLVKACDIYGQQYTTMKPRMIKLLTQQALRVDRPLVTQYGGIVGISLFGPRAVDAFLLPLAREYWERWEGEMTRLTNSRRVVGGAAAANNNNNGKEKEEEDKKKGNRKRKDDYDEGGGREYELNMCQQALLNAMRIFMQNVTPEEQAKRVDVGTFADVFGERLIPMRPEVTEYMAAII